MTGKPAWVIGPSSGSSTLTTERVAMACSSRSHSSLVWQIVKGVPAALTIACHSSAGFVRKSPVRRASQLRCEVRLAAQPGLVGQTLRRPAVGEAGLGEPIEVSRCHHEELHPAVVLALLEAAAPRIDAAERRAGPTVRPAHAGHGCHTPQTWRRTGAVSMRWPSPVRSRAIRAATMLFTAANAAKFEASGTAV